MGPNSTIAGAQTLSEYGKPMEVFTTDPPFSLNEFTISFYWKTDGNATDGILYMDNAKEGCKSPLSVVSKGKDISVIYSNETGCHTASGSNELLDFLRPHKFTFVTLVYQGEILKFYDEKGLFRAGFRAPIQLATVEKILLGYGVRSHSSIQTKPQSTVISCLVVYKVALRTEDLKKISSACRQLISS